MIKSRLLVVLFLLSLFFYAGCASKYASSTVSPKLKEASIVKVVVVPFVSFPEEDQKGLRSAKINPEGASYVTLMFYHGMEDRGYFIIPLDDQTKERISYQGVLPYEVIKSIGNKTGADAVLTGVVTRYENREGGPVGVRKPASVGFETNLTSTIDGTILWNGRYAETQKTLVEDLSLLPTFIKRKGRWLTADELAQYGVNVLLKSLSNSFLTQSAPPSTDSEKEEAY
ncbi:MAG: hypothetical protein A2Y48_04885 [Nitrospirae bacterium RIFCSPLOW2_12_42_9]|nr:MAG: hypothetical protein A2Y48_04885 [Nitrospirae bacterium RIFCSPLOW2_12_42_9]